MSRMKKVLAYLLAFAMVISCFAGVKLNAKAATSEDAVDMTVDVSQAATIDEAGGSYWVKFTPEKDGKYVFYSEGDVDTTAWLYDASMVELKFNDDGPNGSTADFRIYYDLRAEQTYYLETRLFDTEATGSFSICLDEVPPTTSMSFTQDAYKGYVGEWIYPEVSFEPDEAWDNYTLSADKEGIVEIYEDTREIYLAATGTVTLTATTAGGFTDTCTITALEPEEIKVGDTKTVKTVGDESVRYKFTPEKDGQYALYTKDTSLTLYLYECDEDGLMHHISSSIWQDDMTLISEALTAEKTYIFECSNYSSKAGTVSLVEVKPATEMKFYCPSLTGYIGETRYPSVSFGPGVVLQEEYSLTSASDNIARIVENEYGIGIQLVSKGTTTITATSTNGLTCTCTVTVKEYETLDLDKELTLQLSEDQGDVYFTFTPDTSGSYTFYSTDDNGGYGALIDSEGNELAGDYGSGLGNNFKVTYTLEADVEYTYVYGLSYGEIDSVSVMIQKTAKTTGIAFVIEKMTKYVDTWTRLELDVLPVNSEGLAEDAVVTWTSSNPDIVNIEYSDNNHCELYCIAEGTAIITATVGDYSASCELSVVPIPEIKVNETKTVNVQYAHDSGVFSFTPEVDGTYVFTTKSELPVFVEIFNEEDGWDYAEGDKEDPNATLEVEMKAGETYYLYAGYNSSKTGSFTVTLYDAANPPVAEPDNTTNSGAGNSANNQTTTSPNTSDTQTTWIWAVVMLAAVLGVLTVIVDRKKNR